jgi:hypothetical protein
MMFFVPADDEMAARPAAIVPQGCASDPHAPPPPPGATKTPAVVFGADGMHPLLQAT